MTLLRLLVSAVAGLAGFVCLCAAVVQQGPPNGVQPDSRRAPSFAFASGDAPLSARKMGVASPPAHNFDDAPPPASGFGNAPPSEAANGAKTPAACGTGVSVLGALEGHVGASVAHETDDASPPANKDDESPRMRRIDDASPPERKNDEATASSGEGGASTRPRAEPVEELPDTLKVLTFNILHGRRGLDRIVGFLQSQHADVVFLQEVTGPDGGTSRDRSRPHARGQAEQIAAALGGMHVVSAETLRLPPEARCDVAILSRLPLVDAQPIRAGGRDHPCALRATIPTGDGFLHLVCVHTQSTYRLQARHVIESSAARAAEVAAVLAEVRALKGDVIVAGDFNADSWMPEYFALTRTLMDYGSAAERSTLTFPSHRPSVRIDYVFGRGRYQARSYEVAAVLASDHRPIIAQLQRSWSSTTQPAQARGE